jgi:hypothetical protein
VGFPTKETFLSAVYTGYFATWPSLTNFLISKHFPDLGKTQNGHMKGQRKGIHSTKVRAPVETKNEPGTKDTPPTIIKWYDNIFVKVTDLTDTIHTNQTSAFPITVQQGYRYIMVGVHLDSNYIFCELMKNKKRAR